LFDIRSSAAHTMTFVSAIIEDEFEQEDEDDFKALRP
jgi:hypothetical protein